MLSKLAEKISHRAVVMALALAVAMLVFVLSAMTTMPAGAAGLRVTLQTTGGKPEQALGRLEEGRTAYPGTQLPCPCMAVK